jgi:hypothetical protein
MISSSSLGVREFRRDECNMTKFTREGPKGPPNQHVMTVDIQGRGP